MSWRVSSRLLSSLWHPVQACSRAIPMPRCIKGVASWHGTTSEAVLYRLMCMLHPGTGAWNSRILPFRTDKAQGQEADRAPLSMGQKSQQPPWWYQVSLPRPFKCAAHFSGHSMHGRYFRAWSAILMPLEAAALCLVSKHSLCGGVAFRQVNMPRCSSRKASCHNSRQHMCHGHDPLAVTYGIYCCDRDM